MGQPSEGGRVAPPLVLVLHRIGGGVVGIQSLALDHLFLDERLHRIHAENVGQFLIGNLGGQTRDFLEHLAHSYHAVGVITQEAQDDFTQTRICGCLCGLRLGGRGLLLLQGFQHLLELADCFGGVGVGVVTVGAHAGDSHFQSGLIGHLLLSISHSINSFRFQRLEPVDNLFEWGVPLTSELIVSHLEPFVKRFFKFFLAFVSCVSPTLFQPVGSGSHLYPAHRNTVRSGHRTQVLRTLVGHSLWDCLALSFCTLIVSHFKGFVKGFL